MKLSISNIAWNVQENERIYAMMVKHGYTGLEIAPTRVFETVPYERHPEDIKRWQIGLAEQYGFEIPSMQSIWFGRSEKLFGEASERQRLLDYTKKAVDFAEIIACKNLVFGCPKNRIFPEGLKKELWKEGVAFFKNIGTYAWEHHTSIGMEANPVIYGTNYINTTKEAIELIREVASEGFLLNLDIGTMLANKESVEILEENAELINHVHISEPFLKPIVIDRERRQFHNELAAFLREHDYQGYVSIEMGKIEDLAVIEERLGYGKEIFG